MYAMRPAQRVRKMRKLQADRSRSKSAKIQTKMRKQQRSAKYQLVEA